MFVFRSSLNGAWLPAEPSLLLVPASRSLTSMASLLPPPLDAPRTCLWGQVSGPTGRDYSSGDHGSWGNRSWIIFFSLLEDNRTFFFLSFSMFLIEKKRKEKEKGRREGREKERREFDLKFTQSLWAEQTLFRKPSFLLLWVTSVSYIDMALVQIQKHFSRKKGNWAQQLNVWSHGVVLSKVGGYGYPLGSHGKMQMLIQEVWVGPETAFLMSSQVILMLLLCGQHCVARL